MTEVMAQARSMRYEVASNLKGRGVGAAWTCLLPRLEVDAALVVGRVTSAERDALGRLAQELFVIDGGGAARTFVERARDVLGTRRLDVVRVGRGGTSLLRAIPGLSEAIATALSPEGVVYEEHWSGTSAPPPIAGFAEPEELALAPLFGMPRVIIPAGDGNVLSQMTRLGYLPARGSQPMMARVANRVLGPMAGCLRRHGQLIARGRLAGPPRFVDELARSDGYPVSGLSWALVAPGDYASQKVLLMLHDPDTGEPVSIVKLGTDPSHLSRLMNEAAALRTLAPLDLPRAGRAPKVLFAGEHAGRGVVGEEWIRGRPFRSKMRASVDCPHLADATRWLTALAVATVHPRPAADIGEALRDLLDRFRSTFQLPTDEIAFLDARVLAVEGHLGSLPVVFQHGDPGAWNMLIDDDDRVVFLDWESAETDGPPLWDLLYFQRSYGALAARRAGERRSLDAALRHLVTPTPLQARFVEDILQLARELTLPGPIIEPMLYACWMHRALKEATRRTPSTLHGGHYLRLLRALIAHRNAPPLRALMAADLSQ